MNTESERHPLDQLIIECQEQTKQTYGYRRTALWIQKQGKGNWCPLTVLHHMRKLELLAQVRRKRAYTTYKQGGHKYENLLNREFVQEKAQLPLGYRYYIHHHAAANLLSLRHS